MGTRFVKFGQTHVNPARVLFVTEVYMTAEIHMGGHAPIKTELPAAQVIKLLEDAMGDQPRGNEAGHYAPEIVHQALLADVVRYLEEKLGKKPVREGEPAATP